MGILDWLFRRKKETTESECTVIRIPPGIWSVYWDGDEYHFYRIDPKPWDGKLWYPLGGYHET